MDSSIAVSVRNLSAGYGENIILKNVSFDVRKGEILAILGGSGCGKSTLLKHIIGLHTPIEGDILINGRSIVSCDDAVRRDIMRSFGVAYQGGALFRSLTLEENVALPMEEYSSLPHPQIQERVKAKLALVNLDGYQSYMPSDLSGGMVKRAAFARALSLDPEILFFDEPSAGLDPLSSARLDQLILDIRKGLGTTIIIVTHELESIFSVADTAVVLDREAKGIVAIGDPRKLKTESTVPFVRSFLNRGRPTDSAANPNHEQYAGANCHA